MTVIYYSFELVNHPPRARYFGQFRPKTFLVLQFSGTMKSPRKKKRSDELVHENFLRAQQEKELGGCHGQQVANFFLFLCCYSSVFITRDVFVTAHVSFFIINSLKSVMTPTNYKRQPFQLVILCDGRSQRARELL